MGLFRPARQRAEPSESQQLAADLYAGGERADRAVDFLIKKFSNQFQRGGDHAAELFSDWMDVLMEGNEETARKFAATALPMLPAETRNRVLASHGVESASDYDNLDPILQSLVSKIVAGGKGGAAAITTIFNAVDKVQGAVQAQTVIEGLLARVAPEITASMIPHLSGSVRAVITAAKNKNLTKSS